MMQEKKDIIDCYDKIATNYADKYIDELSRKHLDRILLKAFAAENLDKGKIIDLGCGPGHTTKYLWDCGVKDLTGLDLSPQMVKVAKEINPQIEFDTADMLDLKFADGSFGAAIAFYSIVHFDYDNVKKAFNEIGRVLKENGEFLFSFHIGQEIVHREEWFEKKVNIDTYFMEPDMIIGLLKETGFEVVEAIERQPYHEEFPCRRAYVWVKKA